jgi:hypothetical protein
VPAGGSWFLPETTWRQRVCGRAFTGVVCVISACFVASTITIFVGPDYVRTLVIGIAAVSSMMVAGSLFQNRTVWLWVSMVNNLSILFFQVCQFFHYKYQCRAGSV